MAIGDEVPEIVRDAWPEDVGRVVARDEMLGCEVVLGRGDGAPRVVPTPRAVLPFRGTSVAGAAARMAVCTAAVAGTGNGVGSSEAAEPSKICSKPAARRAAWSSMTCFSSATTRSPAARSSDAL
jgi:hypothetical protein